MKKEEVAARVFAASAQAFKEKEYWLDKLSGLPTMGVKSTFPPDHRCSHPGVESPGKKEQVRITLDRNLAARMLELCNGLDYALHMILVAAVTLLLHKYTGDNDIMVGAPIYKQDNSTGAEFVNTVLPLRNTIDPHTTFKDFLLQVKQTLTEAEENQNYPLETLLYHLGMSPSPREFPLFDTAVLLENIHDKTYLRHIPLNMLFCFRHREESVAGTVEYNPDRYRPGTIQRLATHFVRLTGALLADVKGRVAAAELLSDEEKQRLLTDFNDTASPYPFRETLPGLFARQVERCPDRVALTGQRPGDQPLARGTAFHAVTYRRLNETSNRLAHYLRRKGVRPDSLVGILAERTIDTVTQLLAVLKAGGAYLPLDPGVPVRRTASILEDAGAALVLTRSSLLEKFVFTTLRGLRRSKTKPLLTAPREPIKDLDKLPYPDRSLIDYGKYNQYIGQSMAKNIIVVQASRGCPYHCAYCHKIWPKRQVFRSAEHIFAEVKLNYDLGMRKFAFVDDIFNLNRKQSRGFFQSIIHSGMNKEVQFYFPNGLRGDILDREYIDLMVEAGTVNCALALETASPRLQKLLKKNLDLEKFRENIRYLCRRYPHVILELFTMHGFPSETEAEALMTLDFIKQLQWVHFPYINMLKIYPNTDMEQLAIRHGVTRESILRSENFAHFEISDNSPLDKSFTLNYRADFLYNYFLCKERLLHVLPHQLKVLTADEILQKYNSYLPTEVTDFEGLLNYLGIKKEELGAIPPREDTPTDFHLGWQERSRTLAAAAGRPQPSDRALRVLLLDLSQFYSGESDFFYDVMGEAPLGMLYLLTFLNHRFGSGIKGKIAKARIDFDSDEELKALVDEFQPQVIGLRSLNIYKDFFHRTLALLRQWGLTCPVIAGGPYATSDFNTVLQDRHLDLVVLGEGEITFSAVIEAIMRHNGQLPGEDELKHIPGLAFIPAECKENRHSARDILVLDQLEGVISREPVTNPTPVNRSTDLAYTIFTSGSSGKPKGVAIRQRSVHNLVWGLQERIYKQYGPGRYLKVGLVSPFVFDASVKQVFGALMLGHGLCIVPEEVRTDLEHLYAFYLEHAPDLCDGTPAHIGMLSEARQENSQVLRVKHFLIGGEPLSRSMVAAFFNGFASAALTPKITNLYGPSECTVDTVCCEVTPTNFHQLVEIPIGSPMPNCRVLILDPDEKLVPIGVSGELSITGDGVASGYLNNPELTHERFINYKLQIPNKIKNLARRVPSLTLTTSTNTLYKTGDLARWLEDGNIEFLGRLDHQVKIRGFRIELEEIQRHLQAHPKVKDAVVVAAEDRTGDRCLCAYVVLEPPAGSGPQPPNRQGVEAAQLKEYLERELPVYMIPASIIRLERIPLTSSGKVDRSALPAPGSGSGTGQGTAYIAPSTEVENKLTEIWSDLLGLEPGVIGIDTNFFELGGHSLRATISITRIHRALGVKIPLAEVFKTPCIRGLAACIHQVREKTYTPIPPAKQMDYYPLTPALERLYFEQQLNPQSTAYVISSAVLLEGTLEPGRLEETFRKLIIRHESLRTSFPEVDDEPVLRIHDPGAVEFAIRYGEPGQEESRDLVRPFDLSRAPLLRAVLIKRSSSTHLLVANVHHMAADGISIGIIMKEFMALYEGRELPELKIQYKDFAQWRNSEPQKNRVEKQGRFWLESFKGEIPVLELPTDFPRPALKQLEGWVTHAVLGEEETRGLKEIAWQSDTTLYLVTLALFYGLLFKLSGQEDIVVGTPVAGRQHADLQPIVGMFVNTLALRHYPQGNKTFKDFLQAVKTRTLQAFENQDYNFELLVSQVVKQRDLGRNHLFDAFFTLQNMEIPEVEIPGLKLKPYEENLRKVSRFDISMFLTERENRLQVRVEYSTALFSEETIRMFIKNYNQVAAAVIENREIQLKDIVIHQGFQEVKADLAEVEFGFEIALKD